MAMRFQHRRSDEPEINLIPFIDVLLVILIFMAVSTTYAKFTELKVNLPVANAQPQQTQPREILVAVAADGRYVVDRQVIQGGGVEALATALSTAAGGDLSRPVVISADAMAATQNLINVMDAARRVGLSRLTFTAQTGKGAGSAP